MIFNRQFDAELSKIGISNLKGQILWPNLILIFLKRIYFSEYEIRTTTFISKIFIFNPQCRDINFNRISNTVHKRYMGLTNMLQGFQKCIA